MTPSRFGLVVIGAVLAGVPAEAAPFVVDSNLDTADVVLDGTCDTDPGVPVVCTLRAAIQESNFGGVGNTITFNITPLGGVKTIAVNSTGLGGLPTITRAVTINGYTQGVASPNSLAVGSNAVLLIELNGAATVAGVNGLTIAAPTTVRGLVINRFADDGIRVNAGGATSVIAGNYVGTNAAGRRRAREQPGRGRASRRGSGSSPAASNTIGGTAPADRNLVPATPTTSRAGSSCTSRAAIRSRGTTSAPTLPAPRRSQWLRGDRDRRHPGVGSDNNLIGGAVAGAGNLCSGDGIEGIYV